MTEQPKYRTVTLTGRPPPVRIREDAWPIVGRGTGGVSGEAPPTVGAGGQMKPHLLATLALRRWWWSHSTAYLDPARRRARWGLLLDLETMFR